LTGSDAGTGASSDSSSEVFFGRPGFRLIGSVCGLSLESRIIGFDIGVVWTLFAGTTGSVGLEMGISDFLGLPRFRRGIASADS
jgi:hypothetical protein